MKIETSLDWAEVKSKLISQITKVDYHPDFGKMVANISKLVDELSILEVNARRINKTTYTQPKVDEINKAIDHLEKLLLIAQLMN